jgi:hypothetical protein
MQVHYPFNVSQDKKATLCKKIYKVTQHSSILYTTLQKCSPSIFGDTVSRYKTVCPTTDLPLPPCLESTE